MSMTRAKNLSLALAALARRIEAIAEFLEDDAGEGRFDELETGIDRLSSEVGEAEDDADDWLEEDEADDESDDED
jgi:hypothetical protein